MTAFEFVTEYFYNPKRHDAPRLDIKVDSRSLAQECAQFQAAAKNGTYYTRENYNNMQFFAKMYFKPEDATRVYELIANFALYGDLR